MVEKVQKQSVGKNDDHSDIWTIKPKSIIFERLVNLGNYENVRLGGEFKIPEGYSRAQTLADIVSIILEEIELYKQKKVDLSKEAEYQLERAKDLLEDYIERVKTRTSKESEELKKNLITAQLKALGSALKELKQASHALNNQVYAIYDLADSMLQDTSFSLRDLVDSWGFPDEFSIEIKRKDIETSDNKDDEDEDEDEDWDEDDE